MFCSFDGLFLLRYSIYTNPSQKKMSADENMSHKDAQISLAANDLADNQTKMLVMFDDVTI